MKQGCGPMKMRWLGMAGLMAALCLGSAGCDGGTNDQDGDYHPSVDASGKWAALADGAALGVMTLELTEGGLLKGTLETPQGATAQLSGAMDGYVAEFSVTFPAENYQAVATFNEAASGANGTLKDRRGYKQLLKLTRQVAG
jgi:hypothetical protein